jgi:predicted Fe-Mo cluster-binding NifX family protein
MRIAVTASGPGIDARVEPSLASSTYLVVLDTVSREVRTYPNERELDSLAGHEEQAAVAIARLHVDVLLASEVSSELSICLNAAGVLVVPCHWPIVMDAIEEFILFPHENSTR